MMVEENPLLRLEILASVAAAAERLPTNSEPLTTAPAEVTMAETKDESEDEEPPHRGRRFCHREKPSKHRSRSRSRSPTAPASSNAANTTNTTTTDATESSKNSAPDTTSSGTPQSTNGSSATTTASVTYVEDFFLDGEEDEAWPPTVEEIPEQIPKLTSKMKAVHFAMDPQPRPSELRRLNVAVDRHRRARHVDSLSRKLVIKSFAQNKLKLETKALTPLVDPLSSVKKRVKNYRLSCRLVQLRSLLEKSSPLRKSVTTMEQ